MAFLVWDNRHDAEDSLVAVNVVYGCPYEIENGYKMDRWDFVYLSYTTDNCGFFKPEERPGKEVDDLMSVIMPRFTEYEEMPEEFKDPNEPEEND